MVKGFSKKQNGLIHGRFRLLGIRDLSGTCYMRRYTRSLSTLPLPPKPSSPTELVIKLAPPSVSEGENMWFQDVIHTSTAVGFTCRSSAHSRRIPVKHLNRMVRAWNLHVK